METYKHRRIRDSAAVSGPPALGEVIQRRDCAISGVEWSGVILGAGVAAAQERKTRGVEEQQD